MSLPPASGHDWPMTSASQSIDANLLDQFHGHAGRFAFAELHRRYVDFVYAAAFRQCGDAAMAADVTQAVFLVLARRAKSVRAAALPTWLYRVTSYAVKNARRAERRRRRHERAAGIERLKFAMPPFSNTNLDPEMHRGRIRVDSFAARSGDRFATQTRSRHHH